MSVMAMLRQQSTAAEWHNHFWGVENSNPDSSKHVEEALWIGELF